jgi:uncharacterized membrane protein YfcA
LNPFEVTWLSSEKDQVVLLSLTLSVALSGLIGLSLGVFGGGGSILAVPVLVYVTHIAPGAAVGMSLAIVGATSLAASYAHRRCGRVSVPVPLTFGGAGIVTAFLGARLTHLVPDRVLMLTFATLMIVVGGWMLLGGRARKSIEAQARARPHLTYTFAAGAAVGAITGFLGVGGGFLVVPALVAFARLDMREAVGTSLLVIAINSAAGFVGHLGANDLHLGLAALLAVAAVLGALAGERAARHLSVARLRGGFALLVMVVGVAVAVSSGIGLAA